MSNWRLHTYDNDWLWDEAVRIVRAHAEILSSSGEEPRPVDEALDTSPGPAPTPSTSSSPVNIRQLRWEP